jgi:glycosyltransferase involved in cell wall biosynthesis
MTADCMRDGESDRRTPRGSPQRRVSEDCDDAPVKAASLRTVHLSNIANVAYANCTMLESRGISVELYCHDMTHIMSQPEWNDLVLDSADFPDENDFFNNTADLSGYQRPDWFHSGTLFSLMLSNETLERPSSARVFNSFEKILYTLIPRLRMLPAPLFALIKSAYALTGRLLFRRRSRGFDELRDPKVPAGVQLADVLVRAAKQGERWRPQATDLLAYKFQGQWARVATEPADVVYAYALSPIYMMLHHAKPTVAIELDTMREIPFEDTGRGRLLAQSYREADYVLITNPDVRARAEELGLTEYAFCPHPVDENRYRPLTSTDRSAVREKLFDKAGDAVVLFAPARQNWAMKGNDKYLRAMADCLRKGMNVRLIVSAWGQEVMRSKAYCKELGIGHAVQWIGPVSEGALIEYFGASDVVVDQFEYGVFGLITPKALSCGAAVVTSYNPRLNAWCFETPPPLLAASTSEDIAAHIERLCKEPARLREISHASREWVKREHSKARVTEVLLCAGERAKKNFARKVAAGETN